MLIRLEFLTKYLVGLRSGRPENKLHVESVFLLGLSPGVSGESYLLPSFGANVTDLTLAVLQCLVTHLYRTRTFCQIGTSIEPYSLKSSTMTF